MRRASRQRTARIHTTSSTPSAQSSLVQSPHGPLPLGGATGCDYGTPSLPPVESSATEVVLSSAGTFVNGEASTTATDGRAERHRQLAIAIRQRIESRLVGRVRELSVRIKGNTIVLEGKCSTYYTKQLAQHAALGVIEHEHLENAISVEVPR